MHISGPGMIIKSLADPRGSQGRGSNFFHFHAVAVSLHLQNYRLVHPLLELAPPQENPASGTVNSSHH